VKAARSVVKAATAVPATTTIATKSPNTKNPTCSSAGG
jgi:hypothetical protein